MRKLLFIILTLWGSDAIAQPRISEYQTSNKNTLEYRGESPDWIELYNPTNQSIALKGYLLSDRSDEPGKFVFPKITLDPQEYLLLYANGDWYNPSKLEVGFSLKDGKDSLFLYTPDTTLIQSLFTTCVPSDKSYGTIGTTADYAILNAPTPGAANGTDTLVVQLYADALTTNQYSGFYTTSIEVALNAGNAQTQVYYSLNGDDAEPDELLYSTPFTLKSKVGEKDKLADEPTAPEWKEPDGKVYKAQVLRARGFYKGCPVTDELFNTYFIDASIQKRYKVDIVSLITDKDNFFDYSDGIYVPGKYLSPTNEGYSGNYFQSGKAWEKDINVTFFTSEGTPYLQQNAGVRIHGNTTRSYPQKSLRFYARKAYSGDSVFTAPFFSDRENNAYATLILRTASADISNTFFKDPLCHKLAEGLRVDYQSSRPSVVFLNGEYWGIHNIRERQDEAYLEKYYGVQEGDFDLISINNFLSNPFEVESGTKTAYDQMLQFMHNNIGVMNDAAFYEAMQTYIDMPRFIDYHILQLFVANEDWLNANTKYWRQQSDTAQWRWLFFDCDRCFNDIDNERLKVLTGDVISTGWAEWGTELQRIIFQNQSFRNAFAARFYALLSGPLSAGNLLHHIETMEAQYAPLASEQIRRWRVPESVYEWQDNVDALKTFAVYRPVEMRAQLEEVLGIPFKVYPNPATDVVQINTEVATDDFQAVQLEVFDLKGAQHMTKQSYQLGNSINISNLPNGVYFFRLTDGELLYTLPFVVTK